MSYRVCVCTVYVRIHFARYLSATVRKIVTLILNYATTASTKKNDEPEIGGNAALMAYIVLLVEANDDFWINKNKWHSVGNQYGFVFGSINLNQLPFINKTTKIYGFYEMMELRVDSHTAQRQYFGCIIRVPDVPIKSIHFAPSPWKYSHGWMLLLMTKCIVSAL